MSEKRVIPNAMKTDVARAETAFGLFVLRRSSDEGTAGGGLPRLCPHILLLEEADQLERIWRNIDFYKDFNFCVADSTGQHIKQNKIPMPKTITHPLLSLAGKFNTNNQIIITLFVQFFHCSDSIRPFME